MGSWGKLSEDWDTIDEVILYGFGNMAQIYIDNLYKMIRVKMIIDNNINLRGVVYQNIPIVTYQEAKTQIGETKIVVIAETTSYEQIRKLLMRDGYAENRDFAGLERFICEYFLKNRRLACVMEVHTAITTYCTLNCINCNMFIPYYKKRMHMTFEQLKSNIDLLMSHVDYIFKYQIVGGEPFLNKNLSDFLVYLKNEYGDRIGKIRIISNGMVCPDEKLICALQRSNAEVNISDYAAIVGYKDKLKETKAVLQDSRINYMVIPSLRWRDFGFPHSPCNRPIQKIREHMLKCGTAWHGLTEGKLYYCNTAWSAGSTGLFAKEECDYLDLRNLESGINGQVKIMELCLADFAPGYNRFCQLCGGCGSDNKKFVSAGVQMNS